MKLSAVIKWMLILILCAVTGIGGVGVWLLRNGEGLLQSRLLERMEEVAPDLTVHITSTQVLSISCLKLRGIELRDRSNGQPILRCQEMTVTVDEPTLLDAQQVLVTDVRLRGVDVLVRREEDGRWNWQSYRLVPVKTSGAVLPTITLEDVRTQLQLRHGGGLPPANLLLSSSSVRAVPASAERYDFDGDVAAPGTGTGRLSLTGSGNLATRIWSVAGQLRGLQASQQLTELAQTADPGLTERLQQLDTAFERVLPPPSTPDADGTTSALVIGTNNLAPRFMGLLDVDFRASGGPGSAIPEFSLRVGVHEGRLKSATLPISLSDVNASFVWDNRQLVVDLQQAKDGNAVLSGSLQMDLQQSPRTGTATIHIRDFPFSSSLKPMFRERVQRLFDQFLPAGILTADATLQQNSAGQWVPTALQAHVRETTSQFYRFTYPVRDITANISLRPQGDRPLTPENVILDVEGTGRAGDQLVTGRGVVRHPGPEAENLFQLSVESMPIDNEFRKSLEPAARHVLEALDLHGTLKAMAICHRPPGIDQPTNLKLSATVTEADMRFRSFQYDIRNLSGDVAFDSETRLWNFRNLQGRHGEAELTAEGTYRGARGTELPGVLSLTVNARNGTLDADVYNALGPSPRAVWSMLEPSGRVNLKCTIDWTAQPGHHAVVRLPEVEIYDAEIYPRPFPYRMKISSAKLSYDPNDPRFAGDQHCEIHSLQAKHDDGPITGSGWAEVTAEGLWQVHLNDLNATNVMPDDHLRAALPDSWRDTLARLAHDGRVAVESSQLDFRGSVAGDAPPTAAWELNMRLTDCSISAGLDLKHVTGLVVARGTWDGFNLKNSGDIRLDTVEVLDMPLTRIFGPYSIDNDELLLGERAVFTQPDPAGVPPERQLQAQAYGGSILLDGLVDLRPGRGYRLFGTVNNALLESYAARHIPDQTDLRGIVNAWIYLRGEGDSSERVQGRGQLQIQPAALYQLPVIFKVLTELSNLNFAVPNRTAFDYALLTFEVRDRAFWFNPIDLVGDSLALRGRGSVGFGGDVVLDFYSRPPQRRGPSLPFVDALTYLSTTQWVSVQVRGTTERPQTMVRSRMQLDESMRQFLGAFQPNPNGPIPALNIPSIFSLPAPPTALRPFPQPPR